jgi:hypothetical protein
MTGLDMERCIAELQHNAEIDRREREQREAKRSYFVWFGYVLGDHKGDASTVVELDDDVYDAEGLRCLERAVIQQFGLVASQVTIRNFIRLEREDA